MVAVGRTATMVAARFVFYLYSTPIHLSPLVSSLLASAMSGSSGGVWNEWNCRGGGYSGMLAEQARERVGEALSCAGQGVSEAVRCARGGFSKVKGLVQEQEGAVGDSIALSQGDLERQHHHDEEKQRSRGEGDRSHDFRISRRDNRRRARVSVCRGVPRLSLLPFLFRDPTRLATFS